LHFAKKTISSSTNASGAIIERYWRCSKSIVVGCAVTRLSINELEHGIQLLRRMRREPAVQHATIAVSAVQDGHWCRAVVV
jgi:hypothetical protein